MNIHDRALACMDSGRPFAVALVLCAEGSAPQVPGARAVIEADGKIWGTVGGGLAEAEAYELELHPRRPRLPELRSFLGPRLDRLALAGTSLTR